MEQLTFDDIVVQEQSCKARAYGAEFERRLKAVALGVDRKRLAAVCDVSYSYMSEVLNTNNEQNQKPWQTKFTGALMVLAPDLLAEAALDFVLEIIGREKSEPKSTMTPEEELKALKQKIAAHGLQDVIKV